MAETKEPGITPIGAVAIPSTKHKTPEITCQSSQHASSALSPTEQPPFPPALVPAPIDPSPTTTPPHSPFRNLTILTALYLTLFTAALDQTILATAIPTISMSLRSASGYTWIGGAYLVANAASGPVWTKLSDIWGRKPLLLVAVAGFCGASVVCATAKTMQILILGR